MDDTFVYRKSGLGAAQLAAPHGGALSARERHVLILLDGRRTIAELGDLFGADAVQRVVPELEAKGYAKQVDTSVPEAWTNAITLIHVDSPGGEPTRLAARRDSDGHTLLWFFLLAALTVAGSGWATHRYRTLADYSWRLDPRTAQVLPVDVYGMPPSTEKLNENRSGHPAPAGIRPITRGAAIGALKPAPAGLPARAKSDTPEATGG